VRLVGEAAGGRHRGRRLARAQPPLRRVQPQAHQVSMWRQAVARSEGADQAEPGQPGRGGKLSDAHRLGLPVRQHVARAGDGVAVDVARRVRAGAPHRPHQAQQRRLARHRLAPIERARHRQHGADQATVARQRLGEMRQPALAALGQRVAHQRLRQVEHAVAEADRVASLAVMHLAGIEGDCRAGRADLPGAAGVEGLHAVEGHADRVVVVEMPVEGVAVEPRAELLDAELRHHGQAAEGGRLHVHDPTRGVAVARLIWGP